MCLQSRYKAAFDSQFLEVMSELLVSYFAYLTAYLTVYEQYTPRLSTLINGE